MDFRFTEEQDMMAGVVRDLLGDLCQPQQLRALMQAGKAFDRDRWAALVDMGLLGILVPEAAGGLGLKAVDFIQIAEAAGYAALPEPLIEQAGVVLPALAALDSDLLARAMEGELTVALSHSANPFIQDGAGAAAVLFLSRQGAKITPRDALDLIRQDSADPFRRLFSLGAGAPSDHDLGHKDLAPALADLTFDRGALFTAAELLGLARRAVDLAAAYALERQQFGKPIGANQAVKHLLANAQVRIEFARPVLHAAAASLEAGDLQARAQISHAKIACIRAMELATQTAVQVHGAMGYSWEVDVHLFLKRGIALSAAWGGIGLHLDRVADRAFTAPLGPDTTFAREVSHG